MSGSGVVPIRRNVARGDNSDVGILDLQTQRNMEEFFRLAGWPAARVAACVEIGHGSLSTFLEVDRGHVAITIAVNVEARRAHAVFRALLERANPFATGGMPVRVFRIEDECYASCALPPASSARLWLRIYHELRRLVDSCRTAQ